MHHVYTETTLSTTSLCLSNMCGDMCSAYLMHLAFIYYQANSRMCLEQAKSFPSLLFCKNRHRQILLLYVTLVGTMNLKHSSTNIQLFCANKISSL
jgi:hypothetical protein